MLDFILITHFFHFYIYFSTVRLYNHFPLKFMYTYFNICFPFISVVLCFYLYPFPPATVEKFENMIHILFLLLLMRFKYKIFWSVFPLPISSQILSTCPDPSFLSLSLFSWAYLGLTYSSALWCSCLVLTLPFILWLLYSLFFHF